MALRLSGVTDSRNDSGAKTAEGDCAEAPDATEISRMDRMVDTSLSRRAGGASSTSSYPESAKRFQPNA
jgi:hypothetical protein